MSGNQQPQICLPTWRCRDFNAAIPIKKRKYFVLPEEAPLEKNTQPNEQGDTRTALDSSVAHVNHKMIGEESRKNTGKPIPLFPSVSVGKNADKLEGTGNLVLDKVRVKVEEPNTPIHSSPLAGSEILSSTNIVGSSLLCSLEKLPVGAEQHPGVVFTSDETEINVEQTVLKTHAIVRETSSKENLRGECQTEVSAGAANVSLQLGFKPKNSWENEEPSELNLSLSKGVCAPHVTDSISTCTKSGNHSGVNRSNWDLNTTMDAWEDGLDRKNRVKTTGSFFNSNNSSCLDIDTTEVAVTQTVIAKPVSEKQKESVGFKSPTVISTQFDRQVNPTGSVSLALSSYPPVEKSLSLPATTSEARVACTSFSRPIMTAGNVNSVNLRTVKSEVIEESAQAFPIGLSINKVKQEVVDRFRKDNSVASGSLNPVDTISVKAEPNNFTQSEVFNRKDGTLNHPQRPTMKPNEILDLPTSYIPHPSGISNATMSMNGMTRVPGFQSYPDSTLKENSDQSSGHGVVHMTNACSGHGDHNLNASDANVSVTEDKIIDDCKTYVSRGTDELSISGEEKAILSKELRVELCSYEFEPDCGNDLSRVLKKQVGTRNLFDDENVQRPAAMFAEGNRHAECSGSETEQRDIAVPFDGDNQKSNHVEEKESQAALLGNTGNENTKECSASLSIDKLKKHTVDESCLKLVEMASTEVQIKRLTPETQWNVCGSGDNEGRIVQDGEQSTHQIIHASEGMSGVSTLTGGNVDNREIVDNISPGSYKVEMSTIDDDPPPAEFSEGSQGRIKTLDASDSFEPLRMERDRLPDFPFEQRKYLSRWSDESCKFSRERYHGKIMRSPRLNFMPDKRRYSDNTESNLQDRDTKNFESNSYGNTRRGGAFMSNSHRGRRFASDEVSPFPHSFTRRTNGFSFKQRGSTNQEDASACHGFRDGEKITREGQSNDMEPMFMSQTRPYQGGRNSFGRGRTNFSNNFKRGFSGFRSRSPVRSRERSAGPSSSFRNRSQEDFSGNTDFSNRRSSPSGYRMGRVNSPEHSGYPREMAGRRQSPPPYSHRPTNSGRGRGYARGRGYTRGRGYGRDGIPFRKPYDRVVHRNHGNLNNLEPRERVDYSDDFFEGPIHSERFGGDVNVERRQFGYRHDGNSSFRQSFNSDGCAPTNVENGPDAVRCGQGPDTETVEEEQGILMEVDVKNKTSTENASGRSKDMEEEETSMHNEIWQRNELDGDRF